MRGTDERILQATIDAFTKLGYTGMTTDKIAKEASVAEVTLFRKYGSKAALFEKAIETMLEKVASSMTIIDSSTYEKRIVLFLHTRFSFISRHKHFVRMMLVESLLNRLPNHFRVIEIMSNDLIDIIKTNQSDSIDVDFMRKVVIGILIEYTLDMNTKTYHLMNPKEQKAFLVPYKNLLCLQK